MRSDIEQLKADAKVFIANNGKSNPENLADALQIDLQLSQYIVRCLVEEGFIKIHRF